jgi:hypothetical protein
MSYSQYGQVKNLPHEPSYSQYGQVGNLPHEPIDGRERSTDDLTCDPAP